MSNKFLIVLFCAFFYGFNGLVAIHQVHIGINENLFSLKFKALQKREFSDIPVPVTMSTVKLLHERRGIPFRSVVYSPKNLPVRSESVASNASSIECNSSISSSFTPIEKISIL